MRFLEKIDKYIHRNNLLHPEDLYIVALSGGADSVALLLVLKQLGYKVEAAHCNFNLRGEESIRDEQFCVSLCEKQNVPLHRIHFDTKAYAALHKVSIEMAARELRYQYFENLRKDICAKGICVAHHEDDNVETILLHIIRGTGLKGLTGIAPKNGNIIRPLLCITRSDIIAYLESVQQNYVVDSTNLVDDVKRNKIRLNLLPMLEEMNPSVKSNIASMARYLAEAEKITNMSMDGFWKRKADIVTYLPDETAPFDSALDTSARISIQHIMDFFSPEGGGGGGGGDYGFNGIPAALLGSSNPIAVIFVSLFIRYLSIGGDNLPSAGFNKYIADVIIALIIYFAGFSKFIKDFLTKRSAKKTPLPPKAPERLDPEPEPAADTVQPAEVPAGGKEGEAK